MLKLKYEPLFGLSTPNMNFFSLLLTLDTFYVMKNNKSGVLQMEKNLQKVRMPQQKRGIKTRNRIMAAAKKLFSDKGFHGTNAKEIAAFADVSVGSFYAYFNDKKDLFMQIFEEHAECKVVRILTDQDMDIDKDNHKERVHFLIKAILDTHDLSPEFHREVISMRYNDPEVEKVFEKIDRRSYSHVAAFLSNFKDKLRVDDIDVAAMVVSAAVEEVICGIKVFNHYKEPEKMIEGLADMIHRYLFK